MRELGGISTLRSLIFLERICSQLERFTLTLELKGQLEGLVINYCLLNLGHKEVWNRKCNKTWTKSNDMFEGNYFTLMYDLNHIYIPLPKANTLKYH